MSASELLQQVKALPATERRKFFRQVRQLEEGFLSRQPVDRKRKVRWPDATARRRRIFGGRVLPNLVLLTRDEESF